MFIIASLRCYLWVGLHLPWGFEVAGAFCCAFALSAGFSGYWFLALFSLTGIFSQPACLPAYACNAQLCMHACMHCIACLPAQPACRLAQLTSTELNHTTRRKRLKKPHAKRLKQPENSPERLRRKRLASGERCGEVREWGGWMWRSALRLSFSATFRYISDADSISSAVLVVNFSALKEHFDFVQLL